MAEIIVTSYFTRDGLPETGLVPEIRIWKVSAAGQSLIIGQPTGTSDPGPAGGGTAAGAGAGTNGIMREVSDASQQDGFYKFVFVTENGYVPTDSYVFRVDGGNTMDDSERYQVGTLDATDNADTMVDLIYDEDAVEHTTSGTFGEVINKLGAGQDQLFLELREVAQLMKILIKYSANKTRIDHVNFTMTIFDDDCVTPLRVFSLRDANGNGSITEICQRVPIQESDGQAICS